VTAIGTRAVQALYKMRGIPRLIGPGMPRAALRGLLAGLLAAGLALAYIALLSRSSDLARSLEETALRPRQPELWLVLLAVTAAPLFEEIIFRGLVFGGLRRSMGFGAAAVLSGLVFAVVHTPVAALPVFVLALGAAWAYEKSAMLLAPIVAHAVYNGVMVALQLRV
jgi:membrane protease YdiL (CAAX protease family)